MFPKNTTSTTVDMPEKPPLPEQKDSAVVYMVDGDQADADNSRWQIKRAKICACTIVITTMILVVGTLGAIAIVLWSKQGTSEATSVFKEPFISHNSPLEEPIYDPPIKIDDGGLWLPQNPVIPDLVAVDGQGTVALASSPKPDTDGIEIDSEGNPVVKNPVTPDLVGVDGQGTVAWSPSPKPDTDDIDIDSEGNPIIQLEVVPSSESESSPSDFDYYGRTYISSSFPYGGFYMRGESGEPPPSHSEDPSSELSEGSASGDMDSDLEGSAEPEASISSDPDYSSDQASSSVSDPYYVSERR